ncbi:MAG TPA: hypothetical protein VK886_23580 [Vicinamibacterales bacterium]|nr:hypothetical protein [Vicinamibacterales bacterium]
MATDAARPTSRRQWVLLGALVIVLAGVVFWQFGRGTAAPAGPGARTSNAQGRPAPGARRQASPDDPRALDVKLEALTSKGTEPEAIERNPFRFERRRSAQPDPDDAPPRVVRPPVTEPVVPAAPPAPPPPPPIPLKFIGIIESPAAGRVAALSDGKRVFHGRAGQIIDGRYRIVRIGVESIVLEYVDGGPPQTIRLSGQ